MISLTHQPVQNRLLGVQAVFGLGKDSVGVGFEGGLVNFLAAVGGEAVHDEGVLIGEGNEGFVDLITGKIPLALGGFLFHTHGDPDVGVQ